MSPMKAAVALLFALYVLVPLTLAKSTAVKYCDKKNYAVKVSGLDIDPFPISKGKNTTFKISASTDNPISGGKLKIDVSLFWFHIHSEDHNLCEETTCPVTVGDFVVSHSQELPGYTPPGNYNLKMTMVDGNNKQLTCITFDFGIGFVASEAVADI